MFQLAKIFFFLKNWLKIGINALTESQDCFLAAWAPLVQSAAQMCSLQNMSLMPVLRGLPFSHGWQFSVRMLRSRLLMDARKGKCCRLWFYNILQSLGGDGKQKGEDIIEHIDLRKVDGGWGENHRGQLTPLSNSKWCPWKKPLAHMKNWSCSLCSDKFPFEVNESFTW